MHTLTTNWRNALLLAGGLLLAPLLPAKVWILEFVASNDGSVVDEDGDDEDWIEIYNESDTAVDLSGWSLTDDAADLQKWVFPPGTSLNAKAFLKVFASAKNRRVAGDEFHTNFKLSSGGEYLGLIKADGVSVEHDYAPAYPPQVEGASYGIGDTIAVVDSDTEGQAAVPLDSADFDANYVNWNNAPGATFSGSTWRTITPGVGFDNGPGYAAWLSASGDFKTEMWGGNPSVFIRLPFEVSDPSVVTGLSLRMRWDDGFIAYINGDQIAADREDPTPEWDSNSSASRSDSLNDDWEYFTINLADVDLNSGANVLAIHGMNSSSGNSDMLIYPVLDMSVSEGFVDEPGYFVAPSFDAPNGATAVTVPPIIKNVVDSVDRPVGGAGSAPLLITAEVSDGTGPVVEVSLFHRIMFGAESEIVMNDDGTGGDEAAGDGVYSALVPTDGLNDGEMLRWRIEAEDQDAVVGTSPAYLDPQDSDQYYGTVAFDPALNSSQLPIVESFVQNEGAVDTRTGGRVSLYYLGQFYDNVQMDLHGQSTAGFPKKSYDLDFNKGNRFLWREGERRVKDVNLLTNYADKSKVLNTLAYKSLNLTGAQAHFAFAVRVQRNGEFFSVVDLVEDGDERYLDRVGLDEEGTLYKMYDRMVTSGSPNVKKTPKDGNTSDLQALINGVTNGSTTDKRRWAYDNIDIAASVNYLSAYTTIGITDAGHKNYYMYQDAHGTGEWRPLPWDVDLSFGRKWTSTLRYFDPALVTDFTIPTSINPFWAVMQTTPEFRDMMLRRVDTIRDEVMLSNANAAVDDWIEDSIIEIRNQIGTDADLDDARWPLWGTSPREANAMQIHSDRIINDFLPARRNFIFGSSFRVNGAQIASTEPATPNVDIQSVDFLPVSGIQDEEYIILKNNEGSADIDLSGWTLSGAVDYTFPVGTVILSGAGTAGSGYQGLLHIARDSASFRARATGPTGGEFRYVQGGYEGQLSARGETIELRNDSGVLIDSFTYGGTPTANQLALRVTEVNYHPADPTAAESAALPGVVDSDFEFVELKNISGAAIELEDSSFTEGIEFSFSAPLSLGAGERVILAKNPAAFAIRYPAVSVPVVGPFLGQLDNDGETLRLVDGVGENILVFTYNDRWYPPSDGGGLSLVIRDDETAYNALSDPAMWAASESVGGSPGIGDTSWQVHFNAWQEGFFPDTEWLTDGAFDADPDNDGRKNWEEYAYATNPLVADSAQVEGTQVEVEGVDYLAVQVRRVTNGADLIWSLQKSANLNAWPLEPSVLVSSTSNGDGSETAVIRESSALGADERKFIRLHLQLIE